MGFGLRRALATALRGPFAFSESQFLCCEVGTINEQSSPQPAGGREQR